MKKSGKATASAEPAVSLMARAKEAQASVFSQMDALSAHYGADLFRIVGQRYFKHALRKEALRREIAQREDELEELRQKAGA